MHCLYRVRWKGRFRRWRRKNPLLPWRWRQPWNCRGAGVHLARAKMACVYVWYMFARAAGCGSRSCNSFLPCVGLCALGGTRGWLKARERVSRERVHTPPPPPPPTRCRALGIHQGFSEAASLENIARTDISIRSVAVHSLSVLISLASFQSSSVHLGDYDEPARVIDSSLRRNSAGVPFMRKYRVSDCWM